LPWVISLGEGNRRSVVGGKAIVKKKSLTIIAMKIRGMLKMKRDTA
jgi:hypothetical protein